MKIGYLIYGERPTSGLMNSQIITLLKYLSEDSELKITLIAIWQPWVFLKYMNEIKTLKQNLKKYNIELTSLPFGLPTRYFYTNKYLLNINILYVYTILKLFNLNKYDVIHARSYFISYIASLLKREYKLIFDMRSLFVEENISSGKWNENDPIYNKWKNIEKKTIKIATYTIGVSLPMVEIIKKNYNIDSIKYIPIGYDTNVFKKNSIERNKIRKQYGLIDKFVVIYIGSLEVGFWNDVNVYARYFKWLNNSDFNIHFFIITNSNHTSIREYMSINSIKNYTLISASASEIPTYLNAVDAGIQVMNKMKDSETRFGVKTVEYWAANLPVITNDNVGGVSNLINQHPFLGVVINNGDEIDKLNLLKHDDDRIRNFSKRNFAFSLIAKLYIKLYK